MSAVSTSVVRIPDFFGGIDPDLRIEIRTWSGFGPDFYITYVKLQILIDGSDYFFSISPSIFLSVIITGTI